MGAAPTPPRQPPSPKRLGLGLAALALLSASLLALQVFSVDDDVFSELLPPSVEDAWEEVLQRASHTQVRTLSFSVCNGFANQRLSLVFGLVIAKQLGRVVVLPQMLLNGMQTSDENREASDTPSSTPFEEFYDLQALRAALAPFHMRLLTHVQGAALPPSRSSANVTLAGSKPIESVVDHFALHQNRDHISMDCPALYLATGVVQAESKFIRAVLMGLRPSHTVEGYIRAAVERLGTFNFLHLRIERDWQAHCKRWAALSAMDGVVRDNCFNHTIDVHRAMTAMGFDRHVPVYIGSQWEQVRPRLVAESLSGMAAAGFTPIRSRSADSLPRELAALVDFELAMRAERFLGNSVSSFSALVILERHYRGLWAGYYNGGDIPLEQLFPVFSTPWVFTFNSWSREYEPMLKAAVNSALRQGFLTPHCIFAGDPTAPIVGWMTSRGVRLIHHNPTWSSALVALVRGHVEANLRQSHLFASNESIIGTWQRIDLPIMPWLDQFTYVLFTDTDVLFRRPFSFSEFPRPLPRAVGMGPEMQDMFPYNAGIMVANLPRLRETYNDFLAFVLSNREGLTFPGYGPGDQGAYNAFYEADVRAWRLPDNFNSKPYHTDRPDNVAAVAIVHFHGPKPMDYLKFSATGVCTRFGDICQGGLRARACPYIGEWIKYLEAEDAPEVKRLHKNACPTTV